MTEARSARSPATALAVITARGGSRGVPGKNTKLLGGRPLIEYAIEAASRCLRLTDTIVSTDSEEIADAARRAGATVPFLRPGHLAQDDTPHLPVIQHALAEMERLRDTQYDLVVTLQPTSPFRLPEDIDGTIAVLLTTGADSAVSVCEMPAASHPIKAKRLEGNLVVPYCVPEPEGLRRQDLPPAYRRSGAVYVARHALVMESGRFYGDRVAAHIVPSERSIDIDSEQDWVMAEHMLEQLRRQGFPF
jgi:CMP-N-acetylneuraminic acid synthetase